MLHADQGDLDYPATWRMAHVAQETPALDRPAIEYAIDGDATLRQLEAELAALEAEPESAENGLRMAEIYAALADADAYTAHSRAEQLLTGLGFTQEQMRLPLTSFSGGWRMRLNLAQALMCPSDLLLLDEPTNHLDLDAIIWLEDWLKRYPGTLLIISHDRDFLDEVVNVVVHIDERKLRRYSGNYSSFERQRAAQLVLAQGMMEKQMRQRAHLQSFIDRFKAQASKARQAQSRIKALARMEVPRAAAEFSFEFREPLRAPNPLLTMDAVSAGYRNIDEDTQTVSEKIIVSGINFSLQAGQRIGLLGINGAGKSTFIKTIAGELQSLAGDTQFNKGLSIGYFAQHQVEMLRHDESPLWHMTKLAPNVREQELRNFLGSFNFNGAMATSPITPFSGGEGAAGAGADRLAAPQPAAAGRTHQPPGPGNARSADQRAGAVRGHAGAGLARPPPAARQHRPVHHRGRRPGASFRRRPGRLQGLAVPDQAVRQGGLKPRAARPGADLARVSRGSDSSLIRVWLGV